MKYFKSPLIALAFAGMAVQAQAHDAGQAPPDQNAAQPAQPDAAAQPTSPAPDTDAPPPAASPATDAATPPASAAPDASAPATTAVSDSEVDSFAKATVALQKINADTKLDEASKQTKMADAVKSAGIDPARYNAIGQAVASDTALRAKVQMAMAKYAGSPKG